jgi:hypothetical protein
LGSASGAGSAKVIPMNTKTSNWKKIKLFFISFKPLTDAFDNSKLKTICLNVLLNGFFSYQLHVDQICRVGWSPKYLDEICLLNDDLDI